MRLNLLADHLLRITYTGSAAAPTVAFDADGGTNSNGLLTLTDSAAHAIAIDSYATLTLLVAAINALTGWVAEPTPGLAAATVTKATDWSGRRALSDLAATALVKGGAAVPVMVFATAYETVPLSATTALLSAVAVATDHHGDGSVTCWLQGADAGAAGNAVFNLVSNPAGNRTSVRDNWTAGEEWDTVAAAAITVAVNGATAVLSTHATNMQGFAQVKLGSVTNGDDAALKVKAFYQR